jgi:hypothetical protein
VTRLGVLPLVLLAAHTAAAPRAAGRPSVETKAWRDEVRAFLKTELASHFAQTKSLDPPPERVHGAATTGEFSWGTFMRALGAYAEGSGERSLDGRDLAPWIGRVGVRESRAGGKAFSQIYAALALRAFGPDLAKNAVWQPLSPEDRERWRELVDPRRFYDPKTGEVKNLAENYLGVAARIAALAHEMGLSEDRAFLDALIDRSARPFDDRIYADDGPPHGRFDRYSNEYARYVWDAAERAGRADVQRKLRASLRQQMQLWWDVVAPDGYGYNWGRSLGVVSYLDTLEIAAFLSRHPDLRPAPMPEIASAAWRAWRWLRRDYRDDRHLLGVLDPGRGNYSYISKDREWQQTVGFFGKLAAAQNVLFPALEAEGIVRVPDDPRLSAVARFETFREDSNGIFGVWLVRDGPLRFALPFSTGFRPAAADYLPAPHGLPGFAAPVEQAYPALVPFLELADGRTIVAAGAATRIETSKDGRSLRAVWTRWTDVAAKNPIELPLTSDVLWRVEDGTLTRRETLTAAKPLAVRRWWMAVPSTAKEHCVTARNGERYDTLVSPEGTLHVRLTAPPSWTTEPALRKTGDEPLGRGARGAIPLHLVFEKKDLELAPGTAVSVELTLAVPTSQSRSQT